MRQKDSFEDRAYGCILGAFLGDAVGSVAEMAPFTLDYNELKNCLNMIGGGPHGVAPGQVTDDSEMQMCLMWSLILSNHTKDQDEEKVINTDLITKLYIKWLKSDPFDIDSTVNFALDSLIQEENPTAAQARIQSGNHNQLSLGNGALVRVPPLAIWTSTMDSEEDIK